MKTFNKTNTAIIHCHFTHRLQLTEMKERERIPQQGDTKGAKKRLIEERRGVKSKRVGSYNPFFSVQIRGLLSC